MPLIAHAVLTGVLAAAAGPAVAWDTLTNGLQLSCVQLETTRMDCSYRPVTGQTAADISATAAGVNLPVDGVTAYPSAGSVSAILFVVDTSDPGRQAVIEKNKAQIAEALRTAKPHQRFGLATFDSELHVRVPVGSSAEQIASALPGISATGLTTELYRNVLVAIDAVAGVPADRRAIVVFSDGQAEDEAYFHQDVVRDARSKGVIIHSLGFPRSIARSVALQSLRRLSDETGGIFVESDLKFDLPADSIATQLASLDAGGRFSVALAPLAGTPAAAHELEVVFALPAGPVTVKVPLASAAEAAVPASAAGAVQHAGTAPAAVELARREPDPWLWYAVPIALAIIIVLTLVTLILNFRRPAARARSDGVMPVDIKPFAYLISQDTKGARHPIRSVIWRIGRSRDNELTLDDNSVSRRHAEIQRGQDGKFTIVDRESTNGVFVNNEKIGRRDLHDGDMIEIGDIVLRFSETPIDYPMAESTAMLHTRAPRM